MKRFSFHAALAIAAVATGCVTPRSTLATQRVGPDPAVVATSADTMGTLRVYAEFEDAGHGRRRHGDYRIEFDDGRPPMTVHNQNLSGNDGPAERTLAPGTYRVFARAKGYGLVTVPVSIESGVATEVHLERSGEARGAAAPGTASLVRLPDGTPVGWKAIAR
jgi:hypothetical protein